MNSKKQDKYWITRGKLYVLTNHKPRAIDISEGTYIEDGLNQGTFYRQIPNTFLNRFYYKYKDSDSLQYTAFWFGVGGPIATIMFVSMALHVPKIVYMIICLMVFLFQIHFLSNIHER